MKVFISVDMEGITGIVYWTQPQLGGRDAKDDERQRKAMAEDVNVIVKGARQGGAEEFYIWDAHGSSPPRPNLLATDLDPGVYLYSGRSPRWMDVLDSTFDAFIIAGMHAHDGVADGVLSHNFTSTTKEIYVNGVRIGEIGYFALWAGMHGVPTALVTGDEAACKEARKLLGDVETVATKKGIAHGFALLYPLGEVREALAAGAERAIKRLNQFKPFTIQGPPYRVEMVFGGGRETRKADAACMFPWVERLSGTSIGYTSQELEEALAHIRALHTMAETQRQQ